MKDKSAKLVLVVASIILSFLILEFAVRGLGFEGSSFKIKYCKGPASRSRFHPQYGWTRHPGSIFLKKGGDFDDWSLYKYNEEGFRDVYNSGQKNVLVLGDSYTEGFLVDQNSTFAYLLDRWAPNTSFRNFGLAGYSTSNQLMVYKNISGRMNHSLVLLTYFLGNDARGNVEDIPVRPKFTLESGEVTLERLPRNQNKLWNQLRRILIHHSAVCKLIIPWLESLADVGEGGGTTGNGLEHQLEVTGGLIDKIAEREGAELLIVTIPQKREVISPNSSHRGSAGLNSYWEAQRELLRRLSESKDNITLLELKPILRNDFKAGKNVYGREDIHLDEYGHYSIAKSIFNKLTKMGFLENRTAAELTADYSQDTVGCPNK